MPPKKKKKVVAVTKTFRTVGHPKNEDPLPGQNEDHIRRRRGRVTKMHCFMEIFIVPLVVEF